MERFPEFVANHFFLFSLLVVILALLVWNLFGDILSGVHMLNPVEVTRMINKEDAKVLDIRSESDFANGHIINSMNIPLDQLPGQYKNLRPHKEQGIIFCCSNGHVAPKEARKLLNEGFARVYNLKGGIMAWQNAGLPLTKA